MRILFVEDEQLLSDAVVHILRKEGYQVDVRDDGIEGISMAETNIYDLIILDRMLPGLDGLSICKEIRKGKQHTPILFLTAMDSISDRVAGLDSGADDYLVKPFASAELLARVRALLRRPEQVQNESAFQIGSLVLDSTHSSVKIKDKDAIMLTAQETHLLELLIVNKGNTLSKMQILDKVWGFDKDATEGNVELYICYLRKKINFSSAGVILQTVRGMGYCLKEISK